MNDDLLNETNKCKKTTFHIYDIFDTKTRQVKIQVELTELIIIMI